MDTTTRVETYELRAMNGNRIRKATKVIFADGHVIKFMDRMSKRAAVSQAIQLRAKGV